MMAVVMWYINGAIYSKMIAAATVVVVVAVAGGMIVDRSPVTIALNNRLIDMLINLTHRSRSLVKEGRIAAVQVTD